MTGLVGGGRVVEVSLVMEVLDHIVGGLLEGGRVVLSGGSKGSLQQYKFIFRQIHYSHREFNFEPNTLLTIKFSDP